MAGAGGPSSLAAHSLSCGWEASVLCSGGLSEGRSGFLTVWRLASPRAHRLREMRGSHDTFPSPKSNHHLCHITFAMKVRPLHLSRGQYQDVDTRRQGSWGLCWKLPTMGAVIKKILWQGVSKGSFAEDILVKVARKNRILTCRKL